MLYIIYFYILKHRSPGEVTEINWLTNRLHVHNTQLYFIFINNDPEMKKVALEYKAKLDKIKEINLSIDFINLCIGNLKFKQEHGYNLMNVTESEIYKNLEQTNIDVVFDFENMDEMQRLLLEKHACKSAIQEENEVFIKAINEGYSKFLDNLP